MNMQQAIAQVIAGQDLTFPQMMSVMRLIMTGDASPAQIGGFLVGLRIKGESVDEITASAQVMRELATPVMVNKDQALDIVGTGGDQIGTFNISTASCLVAAAAGAKVAKHGNRAASGKTGAADVLEAAGVNLNLSPERLSACVEQIGVGFLFAPKHHTAMKHAIAPRKEMAIRTIFNVLGPLTNPAGARKQMVGVFAKELLPTMAEVFKQLGSIHTIIVHAEDGLDEISIAAATDVAELKCGQITHYRITPEDFGFNRHPLSSIQVQTAQHSLALIKQALSGQAGAAHDVIALNSGAALYAGDLASTLAEGIERARHILASGTALNVLERLVAFSNQPE